MLSSFWEKTFTISALLFSQALLPSALAQSAPLVHYKLDEIAGNVAADSSGNNLDGQYWGEPLLNGSGGVRLDGLDDYIQLPADVLRGLESISVSMDVFIRSNQDTPYFIFGLGNPAGEGYVFTTGNPYRGSISVSDWRAEQNVVSDLDLPRDRWLSIAYVLDGATQTARLYLDGELQALASGITIKPADIGGGESRANYIGRSNYDTDNLLAGSVRQFRLFDYPLNQEQVASLVTSQQQKLQDALAVLEVVNIHDVRGNLHLPETVNGLAVTWSSSAPSIISPSGIVNRPDAPVTVQLSATVTNGELSAKREFSAQVRPAVTLAPFAGYGFSYFTGNSLAGEKIYFAASRGNNILLWDELNGGEPLIESSQGTGGLRDPYIIRSPEGDTFYMIATDLSIGSGTSWDDSQRRGSLYLEVWESRDLVNWSAQRHVRVAPDNAGNAWAPEAYYNDAIGAYVVYWASKLYDENDPNHEGSSYNRMMYATTRDFVNFSEARIWQDDGDSRIDTTVIKVGDIYHRFTKDEGGGNSGCNDIFQESASDLLAPIAAWTPLASCIGRDAGTSALEGPSIVKSNPGDANGDFFYLLADEYGGRGVLPLRTADIANPNWTLLAGGFDFPSAVRHGTVLPVTAEELANLRQLIVTVPDAAANPQGEILRYDFQGSNGDQLRDVSGNGYHGTLHGGAELSEGVLVFDGVDDFVDMPDNLLAGVSDVSIEAEIYIEPSQSTPYFIYGIGNTEGSAGEGYLFTTGNPYRSSISPGNWSGEQTVSQGEALPRGRWLHIAYTLQNSTARLFLDGVEVASGEIQMDPQDIKQGRTLANYLGRSMYPSDRFFAGRMREFALYNRALSAQEVLSHAGNTAAIAEVSAGIDPQQLVTQLVDAQARSVVFIVDGNTDITQMSPSFITAENVQVWPAPGSQVDLSQPVTYTLESGDTAVTWTFRAINKRTPILPGLYADPNIFVHKNTYYIYATTDGVPGWGGKDFYSWSSKNLRDWTRAEQPFLTLDSEQGNVPWASGNAWAPTIIRRGGYFYFYFSGHNPSYNRKTIGVAVAEHPEGPFIADPDAMITNDEDLRTGQAIDPAAFKDPRSGKYYLFWGNGGPPLYAELAEDMRAIVPGTLGEIAGLPDFREGVFVIYREGLYHLMYSIDDTGSPNYRVGYASASDIHGPWTYRGVILEKRPEIGIFGTGHNSALKVPGTDDWYIVYHRFAIPDGSDTRRETTIDRLHFDADSGLIQTVTPTLGGVEPQCIRKIKRKGRWPKRQSKPAGKPSRACAK